MKRIVCIITTVMMLAAMMPYAVFAASDDVIEGDMGIEDSIFDKECDHDWNDWVIKTDSTCTKTGVKERTCEICEEVEEGVIELKQHTEVIDHAVSATCTKTGLTEGKHCSVCGKVFIAQEETPVLAHEYGEWTIKTDSTCTETGIKVRTCNACGHPEEGVVDLKPHAEVIDPAVEATCTTTGLTEGKHCSVCGKVFIAQEETPMLAHEYGEWAVKTDSTCTATGIKIRSCKDCGHPEEGVIDLKPHIEVIDPAAEATCTKTGLTEGKHCSVCGKVFIAQEEIPMSEHDFDEWTIKTDSTCSVTGIKVRSCKDCGHSEEGVVDLKPHTEVIDPAVEATCTKTGLTEGKHCLVCGEVYVAQEETPMSAHDFGEWIIKTDSTCTATGIKVRSCKNCGHPEEGVVDLKPHTEVIDPAVEATCTKTGLTEGKHCLVCGEVYVAQEETPMAEHDFGEWIIKTDSTCTATGIKVRTCKNCGYTEEVTIPAIKTIKLEKTKFAYDGKVKIPVVIVTDTTGNAIEPANYSVTYTKNIIKTGRYKVTVKFKGDYEGSKVLYFTVVPNAPSKVTASLSTASKGYDNIKLSWSKCTGASGYTIYYKRSVSKGYTFLKRTTGTSITTHNLNDGALYYFKVVPYYKSGSVRYAALTSKIVNIYTLKKLSTPTVSKSGTKVKVKWKNISGETGYQISRSTKKTGTNVVYTYKTTTGTYKTVSATKGKTYYYKVRAYKNVLVGKKYVKVYGPWSSVKAYKR